MLATIPPHVAQSAYLFERRHLPYIARLFIKAAVWFTKRDDRQQRLRCAEGLSDHLSRDIGISTVRYDRTAVHNFPPKFL